MKSIPALLLSFLLFSCNTVKYSEIEGLNDSDTIVYLAVVNWYQSYRDHRFDYSWNERSGFITDEVKKRLQNKIRQMRPDGDGAWFFQNIEIVEFPLENFAYIEIMAGDSFFQYRYVTIFEKQVHWEIIDSFLLAEGFIGALSTRLNFESYYKELMKSRSNQSVEDNDHR